MSIDPQWQSQLIRAINKYSDKYAEPEFLEIAPFIPNKIYQHSLVIPAYNESSDFVDRLINSPLSQQKTLLVIIINQPDTNNDTSINQQLWNELITSHQTINHSDFHHWLTVEKQLLDILLINRFTHKIPSKQGVGLARKVGGDIICKLIQEGCLNNYWINNTDADAHLPDNYFVNLYQQSSYQNSAAIYSYIHQNSKNQPLVEATRHYEKWLNYYVNQLQQAGSPYAYHTLGSCIATNALHYCQARGFPKRAAGEDFYLLNKLTKLGKVVTLKETLITLEARLSNRVPFGTGPAVEKILSMNNPVKEYLYYHPQCFQELSSLLQHFEVLFSYKHSPLEWLNQLSLPLQDVLHCLGIEKLFSHIKKQVQSAQQCKQHCHDWLDGFRTLKLIHLLEKKYYPRVPFGQVNETSTL